MSNKPLNIGEEARVQMPMKTVASLIVLVAMGVFAYTELTARLVLVLKLQDISLMLMEILIHPADI